MSLLKNCLIDKIVKLVINYSCDLLPGERILVEAISVPIEVIVALLREAKNAGGIPLVNIKDDQVIRELCCIYDERDIELMADCELYVLKRVNAFVGIRGFMNKNELSDVPIDKMKNMLKHYIKPVHFEQRNLTTKWVVLRWPTHAMAQSAGMSTEAFMKVYFSACATDYAKMEKSMKPLLKLMQGTERVKILGPGETDISFSIKGMPQYGCAGRHNIPDGELFTAPIRNSVNGRIEFNVPSVYYGTTFQDVCFDFKDGKIIMATCDQNSKLNDILNQDDGARYIGEFAFGFNPHIVRPIKDILFDEKISGSIHLAIGNAYRECDNSNRSSIHWDLVLMQTPEMGGGEIYFDDTLIRKDGKFTLEELSGLNPANLI